MDDKLIKPPTDYRNYVEEFDLQRYWLVLKRRWLPASIVFLTTLAAATYHGATRQSTYEASGKLLLQVDRSTALTGVGAELGRLESLKEFGGDPLATQSDIITSIPVLQETITTLDLRDDDGAPLSPLDLREDLTVAPLETADIINLSYDNPDPQQAAAVVNQIMESYVQFNVAMNRSEATVARDFVERQLPKAQAELEQAAAALRQFKDANQVYALEAETVATVDAVNNLNNQINLSRASLTDANTQSLEIQRKLGMPLEQALQLDTLSQSPGVQQALVDLQTIQTQVANESARYTPNHPIVQNLVGQEQALRLLLNQRVAETLGQAAVVDPGQLQMTDLTRELTGQLAQAEINRQSLFNQIQTLNEARNAYIARSQTYPFLEQQQLELEQRLTAARTAYETLLERAQEANLAENQRVGSAQIIEAAMVPLKPVSGGWLMYVAAGILGGGLLAVATAFLLDLVDQSVKTVKDAEALLEYTLLGLIPKFSTGSEEGGEGLHRQPSGLAPGIVTPGQGRPFIAGAYQMLQANLKFIRSDQPLRSMVMTSSVAQEGKSEVSANLAATMAQAGKRVLLVDADLRSPSQHHLWNVLNTVGLSHVLVGEGQIDQALTEVAPNLTLLTAGVIPPNPLALLDSERMAALVETLSSRFDYVIFDTPPLVGAPDAAVLGKATSGILLVVRPRLVDAASLGAAKSLLERSGASVLGFIANGVDIRNEHDDYVSLARTRPYGASDRRSEPSLTV
ncbi:MAG: GumC family protein [Nodosilinea sp.]